MSEEGRQALGRGRQPAGRLVPDMAQPVEAVQRITHGGAVQGADLGGVAQAHERVKRAQHVQVTASGSRSPAREQQSVEHRVHMGRLDLPHRAVEVGQHPWKQGGVGADRRRGEPPHHPRRGERLDAAGLEHPHVRCPIGIRDEACQPALNQPKKRLLPHTPPPSRQRLFD